jgi:parallel beta-helix repeat protein
VNHDIKIISWGRKAMEKTPLVKKYIAVGIILLFVGMAYAPAMAQTNEKQSASRGTWLYVGGSGPGNYSKIQNAINDSQDGDTVFVYDDSSPYYESLIINTSITLMGENRNTTIIDGNNVTSSKIIDVMAPGFTLTELCIQHCYNYLALGAVFIGNDEDEEPCSITHNVFRNISNVAIYLKATHALVSNNTFLNNTIGVVLLYGGYHTVENNVFINNGIGIYIQECHWNTIRGNTIVNFTAMEIFFSHYNVVSENILNGNKESGINSGGSCKNTYSRNVISNYEYGLNLQISQQNTITENNFINNSDQASSIHIPLYSLILWIDYKQRFVRNASIFSFIGRNQWEANYWSDWNSSSPRPIDRVFYFSSLIFLSRITGKSYPIHLSQYDWHPAQEPYDIPGMS